MKKISILLGFSILVTFLFGLESYFNGPENWIMKYDLNGQPIHSVNRESYFLFIIPFFIFMNLSIFLGSIFLATGRGFQYVNIPNKEYWKESGNRLKALEKVRDLMFGVLIFVNMTIICVIAMARFHLIGLTANLLIGGIFVGTGVLIYWTYDLFRIPKIRNS